jgi:hypothetical protein
MPRNVYWGILSFEMHAAFPNTATVSLFCYLAMVPVDSYTLHQSECCRRLKND